MVKSVHWYHLAADLGDASAHARLGDIYSMGESDIFSMQKAIHHYKEAAMRLDVSAQYNYAVLLVSGNGPAPNYRLAETLFHQAATSGHIMAMVNLAQMYTKGYGDVPKNLDLAVRWLKLSAPYDLNAKTLLQALQNRSSSSS